MLFTPHLWLPKAAAVAYSGPGDAVSGAYLWGGLRAYTAASIGSNVIRLHAADATEADFKTISGGGLDLTSINSFISTHGACTVAKLYDQTGNGRDLVQATVGNQPVYSSTSGPGSKPGLTFNLSSSQFLSASGLSQAAPLSFSFVAQTNPDGVHDFGLGGSQTSNGGVILQRGVSVSLPNTLELYDGNGFARVAATDNTWLAVNTWTTSAGNGTIEVNGTQVTAAVNFGSDAAMNVFYFGTDTSRYWQGLGCEAGVWPGGSTTTIDTVNGNQRTYWGF